MGGSYSRLLENVFEFHQNNPRSYETRRHAEPCMPRQSKYQKCYCDLLLSHMKQGLSFESFGGVVHVAKQTLYSWLKAHPEFKEAKEIGDSMSLFFWEKLGLAATLGQVEHFNTGSWLFNVRNRFGWKTLYQADRVTKEKQVKINFYQVGGA